MTAAAVAGLPLDVTAAVQIPSADDNEDQVLQCVQVQQVTHDVRTFVFEATGAGLGRHEPGQYLVLGLEIAGETVERCYTISSPPTRPDRVAITVKREPDGLISNWLHDHLDPGARVVARGPYGRFSVTHHPAQRYLLLSGGSGATPMMSTMRTLFDLGNPVDVAYVHSARTPSDILFRQELDWMCSSRVTSPTLAVTYICERSAEDETWFGASGFVDADILVETVPDIAQREVFVCGPPPYLEAVREIAASLGVPPERYHEEAFVALPVAEPPTAPMTSDALMTEAEATTSDPRGPSTTAAQTYLVEFARSQRRVECAPGTTLLAAAMQAGVTIPSSCGEGVCGTCKLTRLSGEVEMNHLGGIRAREIAGGKILPCCSVPTTDVVLDA